MSEYLKKWLAAKGATPTEEYLYKVLCKVFKETGQPVASKEIVAYHATHRTNVYAHMRRMIGKGMIKKPSRKFYKPVQPKEKRNDKI